MRRAYHTKVKACHPDQFSDGQDQQKAQEQLIQLNLAYEDALRLAMGHPDGAPVNVLSVEEAKHLAMKLMEMLWQRYPEAVTARYKVEAAPDEAGWALLQQAGAIREMTIQPQNIDYLIASMYREMDL